MVIYLYDIRKGRWINEFWHFAIYTINEAKTCRTYAKIGLCIINKRDRINRTFTLTIADLPRLYHGTPMGKSL